MVQNCRCREVSDDAENASREEFDMRRFWLVPTFRSSCSTSAPTFHELRKVMGTSKLMMLVPPFHLKFLDGICRLRCRNFKWAALGMATVMEHTHPAKRRLPGHLMFGW